MELYIFFVCLCASCAGGICGIGGGVVIKPVLDTFGVISVSEISFLSGCTVLAMSSISVIRQRKQHQIDLRIGGFLGAGAALGGVLGNGLFHLVKAVAGNDSLVGMAQAIALGIITGITLLYSAFLRKRIRSYSVASTAACLDSVFFSWHWRRSNQFSHTVLCFFHGYENRRFYLALHDFTFSSSKPDILFCERNGS